MSLKHIYRLEVHKVLSSLRRFDELPPVRPMRDEDPYFSSMRARSSPPDFMPSYQSAPKKPQLNEARPRRVQAQKSRTADGQVRENTFDVIKLLFDVVSLWETI